MTVSVYPELKLTQIHVLLIEDDPGDAFLIQQQLQEKSDTHFVLHPASCLSQAGELLAQQDRRPDVILLDLNLPDSWGITSVVKARELLVDIPIVVLTGDNDFDLITAAIEAGAEDYLHKGAEGGLIRKALRYAILRHERDRNERIAMTVFNHAREGIMVTDAQERILHVNQAFTDITGYSAAEVLGKTPRLLNSGHHPAEFFQALHATLESQGHWQGELWNRHKDGSLFVEHMTVSAVRDAFGQTLHYVGLITDITQKKEDEARITRLAYYDALTELPNRSLFMDRLQQALTSARRHALNLAIVFIDLDGFKAINDQFSHAAGDYLLQRLAQRMKGCLRDEDTLARLAGDEFIAMLFNPSSPEETEVILERLRQQICRSVHWQGQSLEVSASLGVKFLAMHEFAEADRLVHLADQAMYQAKKSGKNCVVFA
ncbi:diguanylate cyclase [Nitrincola tapanii]|uniref:Diguanylate cyclase n=1 Tax=Nitrincola tapanii TaxID=1708751 RepID=A0A5A9W085_9GAMM|nr:diguanylate cyclase [Nitrincola tapanii]KAA0874157.1 diguanylate cyclase [Nitrincola tapanii]